MTFKKHQIRRKQRSLLVANERRLTKNGAVLAPTRKAIDFFRPPTLLEFSGAVKPYPADSSLGETKNIL